MTLTPARLVQAYWQRMQSNDFASAAELLAEDFILEWPQSRERVRGRENFVRINREYPAHGPWQFKLCKLVAQGHEVVTEVDVTDGVIEGRAITFSTVEDGLIRMQREFWPDPYEAAANRAQLVERY